MSFDAEWTQDDTPGVIAEGGCDERGARLRIRCDVPGEVHRFVRFGRFRNLDLDGELSSVVKFQAQIISPDPVSNRVPIVLFAKRPGEKVADAQRFKFFAGDDARDISFEFSNTDLVAPFHLILRVGREFSGTLEIRNFGLIGRVAGEAVFCAPMLTGAPLVRPLDLSRNWTMDGSQLLITWLGEAVRFRLPDDWNFTDLDDARRSLVEDFLFGSIENRLFGVQRRLETAEKRPDWREIGADGKTLLAFSTGEDSTAALAILPEGTACYFCERPFDSFYSCAGDRVALEDRPAERYALDRVPDCILVPTDMELLNTKFGGKLGNPSTLAVVAIGVLLAGYTGSTSVSIGAQLETSYLRNGQVFTDIFEFEDSIFWRYKRLFNEAGLDISYPTAALSEVLTNAITLAVRDQYFAVPCPHTNADLEPCGHCPKCFRKMQLSGTRDFQPDDYTRKVVNKHPLKMATSAIYAARKGGYSCENIAQYDDMDLSFLERYYGRAIETLTPLGLHAPIEDALKAHGYVAMSEDDELKLRAVGRRLHPERHDEGRAMGRFRELALKKID